MSPKETIVPEELRMNKHDFVNIIRNKSYYIKSVMDLIDSWTWNWQRTSTVYLFYSHNELNSLLENIIINEKQQKLCYMSYLMKLIYSN